MRSEIIIIVGVTFQNSAQMRLAQDNNVVHTFTPDRSDQPFGKSILPGRRRCNGPIPDADGAQSARDDPAVDPVAIADHVARHFVPRECFCDLACNPFCRRSCCDVDPDEISAVQPDDDEGIEQVEANGLEQRTNPWRQCPARGYTRRCAIPGWGAPSFDHVLGDARLRDLKPELEQFAGNAWRAPKRILAGSTRATLCRSAVAIPMGAISNASKNESRLNANARASRAG